MAMLTPAQPESALSAPQFTQRYEPRGGALALLMCRDREALLEGPAGTGKSFAALWKLHLAALKYPGMRGLLLRKTLVSLKASTLVTYRERVLGGSSSPVHFWAARGDEPAHYAYPNGSKIIIGGMDNAAKIMSTEYDLIFWDEATDGDLAEWEALQTRLRYGRMPYQQAVACVNPQGPTHWLNTRANEGRITRLYSRHEDNPSVTLAYLQALGALSGVRRQRLLLGLWVAADGMVYENVWDPATHIAPRARYCAGRKTPAAQADLYGDCGIDPTWPRYLGIDWGYRNPAVIKWYARMPDGELLVYRELYTTMMLVEDLARESLRLMGWRHDERSGALLPTRSDADPLPREIIADHDAEDRATFERHFGMSVYPADKGKDSISDGIQAVTKRLQDRRLLYLADSLVRRDPLLELVKQPASSLEEFESYVWDLRAGRQPKEVPLDEHNHGMDVDRYVVRYFDREEPSGGAIPFQAVGY